MESQRLALDFVEKHHLQTVFQELTTALVYYKPENPLTFLVESIQVLRDAKSNGVDRLDLCMAIGGKKAKQPTYTRKAQQGSSAVPAATGRPPSAPRAPSADGYRELPARQPRERITSAGKKPSRSSTPPEGFQNQT